MGRHDHICVHPNSPCILSQPLRWPSLLPMGGTIERLWKGVESGTITGERAYFWTLHERTPSIQHSSRDRLLFPFFSKTPFWLLNSITWSCHNTENKSPEEQVIVHLETYMKIWRQNQLPNMPQESSGIVTEDPRWNTIPHAAPRINH